MEPVQINGAAYRFFRGWPELPGQKVSFDRLARRTFGFDFARWTAEGHRSARCIAYQLLQGERVVSHLTVSVLEFLALGEPRTFVQFGTVMTDPAFRGQGLSRFLLDRALADWERSSDLFYLYANDSVRAFYPRFGFSEAPEYHAFKPVIGGRALPVRKIDLQSRSDRSMLAGLVERPYPVSRLTMQGNPGLLFFYCGCCDLLNFADRLYGFETLDAVAVAEQDGEALRLIDLFCRRPIPLEAVAGAFGAQIRRLELPFVPAETEGWEISPFHEEDSTLMVRGRWKKQFYSHRLCFPPLTHT